MESVRWDEMRRSVLMTFLAVLSFEKCAFVFRRVIEW